MTETELVEALAVLLRAETTDPLKSCEVHIESQVGYEAPGGSVTVLNPGGDEVAEAIGEQFADEVRLRLVGLLDWKDTQANRRDIKTLCKQLRTILRGDNRRLTAGGEITTRNSGISWEYGYASVGNAAKRTCQVDVVYRIRQS